MDFLPALLLLAVVGILGVERMLTPTSELRLASHPVWRRTVRCSWVTLLVFSVAFNLLASVEHYAEAHNFLGNALEQIGQMQEAIGHFEQAVRINPDYVEAHFNLGVALEKLGRTKPSSSMGRH